MDRYILSEDEVIPKNQIQRAESTKDSTDIYNFILINNLDLLIILAILQNSTYKRVHIGYFLDFFDEFFPSKNRGKKILETAYRCCTKAEKRLLVLHLTLKKFIGAGGYPKHGKLLIGATAPNM